MARKKLVVEMSEAQVRSLLWAIDSLDLLYGNPNDVDEQTYREGKQAFRNLAPIEQAMAKFVYERNVA